MKDEYNYTNSHYLTYVFLLKVWENVPFELGSEWVDCSTSPLNHFGERSIRIPA